MSVSVSQLLTDSLGKIRAARAGDVIGADDAALALRAFNALLDALNVKGQAIYNHAFATFTLTANHQPHTIGVTANTPDFTVTTGRPSRIVRANLILPNNIRSPLRVLDDDGWNEIRAGAAAGQAITITSSVPQFLYYDTSWPNGGIYLYPVPTAAYGLELLTETLLASVTDTDTLDLPFGYQLWLTLKLAQYLASDFGQSFGAENAKALREVEADLFGTNTVIPELVTLDAGMPGGSGGTYDHLTGLLDLPGRS